MSFSSFDDETGQRPLSEINMVPLIDVMLVLLVIFIITAPLLTHSVKIDLPRASSTPNVTKPERIEIAIRADGSIYWNGETIELGSLGERFSAEAHRAPQPELHIRADRQARYEPVAKVMSAAARAGLSRIGFVTDPAVSEK